MGQTRVGTVCGTRGQSCRSQQNCSQQNVGGQNLSNASGQCLPLFSLAGAWWAGGGRRLKVWRCKKTTGAPPSGECPGPDACGHTLSLSQTLERQRTSSRERAEDASPSEVCKPDSVSRNPCGVLKCLIQIAVKTQLCEALSGIQVGLLTCMDTLKVIRAVPLPMRKTPLRST